MQKTLTFSVFGRGPKGQSLAITDTIELPENITEAKDAPSFDQKKYENILNDDNLDIEEQLEQLDKMQTQHLEAKNAFGSVNDGKGLTIEDQVRVIGIKYLCEHYGEKISLEDVPNKFLIKENEIELMKDPEGNYVFELATTFGS